MRRKEQEKLKKNLKTTKTMLKNTMVLKRTILPNLTTQFIIKGKETTDLPKTTFIVTTTPTTKTTFTVVIFTNTSTTSTTTKNLNIKKPLKNLNITSFNSSASENNKEQESKKISLLVAIILIALLIPSFFYGCFCCREYSLATSPQILSVNLLIFIKFFVYS